MAIYRFLNIKNAKTVLKMAINNVFQEKTFHRLHVVITNYLFCSSPSNAVIRT